jgi:protein gp37
MTKTTIEWTEETLNWITGCTKISAGCKNCYAERMTARLKAMGQAKYKKGFSEVVIHPEEMFKPLKMRKPRVFFVNSMADTFHQDVPFTWICNFFNIIDKKPQHTYQILTKRSRRMYEFNNIYRLNHLKNLWLGVTVENKAAFGRINHLRATDAHIKFLSCEPLLESLEGMDLTGIDWVIVGGESGPGARPIKKEWVLEIKEICKMYGVKFFFKQWGGINKKKTGRLLDGKEYNEMPAIYRPIKKQESLNF